jgi:DNA polymerase
MDSNKLARYRDLVTRRKHCELCPQRHGCKVRNPAHINHAQHDSDEIGPYSRWQGNLNSELMVVAQDFADVDSFCDYEGWPGGDVHTNRTLVDLVSHAGITIKLPENWIPDDRLFFTNAVLCMKQGRRQTPIPHVCVKQCAQAFLRELILIVDPKVVVTLGRPAMRAVHWAFGMPAPTRLSAEVGRVIPLTPAINLVPLYHPSPSVINISRDMEEQRADWKRLGEFLFAQRASAKI